MSFIPKELVNILSENHNEGQEELIEKDLILHRLLLMFSSDLDFKQNYFFKGGTCITKAYLGYYRFSEDLDFSFINQDKLKNKTNNQKRKIISEELGKIINLVNNFCNENNLKFKKNKGNEDYFDFRGGNKFTTIKFYYQSSINNLEKMIKIQFSFEELFNFKFEDRKLENNYAKRLNINLPGKYDWIFKTPQIRAYSLNEILSEKIRAILTREGVKSRDFIDIYKITSGKISKLEEIKKEIIDKVLFMLSYKKYENNLTRHSEEIPQYKEGDGEYLLISPLEEEFYKFLPELEKFLIKIINKIKHT